jgi:hypothetical protein
MVILLARVDRSAGSLALQRGPGKTAGGRFDTRTAGGVRALGGIARTSRNTRPIYLIFY